MKLRSFCAAAFSLSLAFGIPIAALAAYDYYINVPLKLTHIGLTNPDGIKIEVHLSCWIFTKASDSYANSLAFQSKTVALDASGSFNDVVSFKMSSATPAHAYTCELQAVDPKTTGLVKKTWTPDTTFVNGAIP